MTEKKAQSYADIWSIKDEVIEKNKEVKKKVFDIPDEDLVAHNVKGFVINEVGNIVAQFGFFVETEGKDKIELRISPDGFLAAVYNKPTNIILGYGHPLGFNGMIDVKQSNILHLGPDQANGDQLIINIQNDETLEKQGIVCMIRDVDVLTDILPPEVAEDFNESIIEAKNPIEDLNEIEDAFNKYLQHIYKLLGKTFNTKDNVEEEDVQK